MNVSRDPDRLIREFLDEGLTELPERAYDTVRFRIDHTRQRVVIGPWRSEQVTRYATYGIAAAVIVLAVVVGIRFLPSNDGIGVGSQPTSTPVITPSPAPTEAPTPTPASTLSAAPSPAASAIADPVG